jgi:alpha-tubulin suppressor-like RCC1 family protein
MIKGMLDPFVIKNLKKIKRITTCATYGLALAENNQIYKFSYEKDEEISLLNHTIREEKINLLSMFYDEAIFITDQFNVYIESDKYFTNKKFPVPYAVQCVHSIDYVLILSLTGQVYATGDNRFGQLGLGNYGFC